MPVEKPSRKVNIGLAAGATMTILAWLSKAFGGPEIPAEVALSGSTLIIFILQYMVPNAE